MSSGLEIKENTKSLRSRNRVTGLVMSAIGAFVIYEALSYNLGTAARMGPGFLPLGLGILIIVFGVLVAVVNDDGDEAAVGIVWRPVVLVLSALLAFALLIEPAGLMAATAALVFISGHADPSHTWRSLTGLFLFLLISVYLVFGIALSIPFKLVPGVI
ncbi:MAG: tripartite tricarboxylate transporter TctB family protein [Roseibium sp.]|uniref:tripartite tricarboxylate transporter TctB family protein n=1 Tax=Roseibium sp. TaxID=1936156 RepID=UPI00260F4196|nr:tripartite tricarboxylate transporter TctB family protein [Roseibium sp.]MCV0424174.1 tripartite tricarboxylate transporter TctB family protein [Roseibium sp.]